MVLPSAVIETHESWLAWIFTSIGPVAEDWLSEGFVVAADNSVPDF
jgi:hypothetical protein